MVERSLPAARAGSGAGQAAPAGRPDRPRARDEQRGDRADASTPRPVPNWAPSAAAPVSVEAEVVERQRGAAPRSKRVPAPLPEASTPVHVDKEELVKAVGPQQAPRFERKLREAARAFDRERFDEALPTLRMLAREAPTAPSIRELFGLTLYRMGRWSDAIRELEAFTQMTQSTEQHPVLADCYRAQRRWDDVERVWIELREASPSSALVNEGRLVAAGALADQGQLPAAVALLAKGFRKPRHLEDHHLRRMYALADLYEKAGDLPRARTLFREVAAADPDFVDAIDRVRALG
ncbi:MAG: tetratricopeptide repeat protein [Acidimicrobiia bacterium]